MTKRCLYESIGSFEFAYNNIDFGDLHDCYLLLLSSVGKFFIYTFKNPGPLKIRIRNKSRIVCFKEATRMTRVKGWIYNNNWPERKELGPGIVIIETLFPGFSWARKDNKKVEELFEALFI